MSILEADPSRPEEPRDSSSSAADRGPPAPATRRGLPLRSLVCHLFSVPSGLGLVIAFLLPWAQVSCGGSALLSASGIGVATGDWNAPEDATASGPKISEDAKQSVRVPFELLLVPIAGLAAFVLGSLVLAGRVSGPKAVPMLALALALGPLLAVERLTDFGIDLDGAFEQKKNPAAETDAQAPPDLGELSNELGRGIRSQIRVEPLAGYWAAVVATSLLGLGGFLGLILQEPAPPRAAGSRRRRRIPSGEGAPGRTPRVIRRGTRRTSSSDGGDAEA